MPYETATVKQVDEFRAVVIFTGPDVKDQSREMPIGVDPGIWTHQRLAELNAKQTTATTKPVQEGQVIDPVAPVPNPQQAYEHDRAIVLKDAADVAAGIARDAGVIAANLAAAAASAAAYDNVKG